MAILRIQDISLAMQRVSLNTTNDTKNVDEAATMLDDSEVFTDL